MREAIILANTDGTPSKILFDIPADDSDPDYNFNSLGYWSIKPQAELTPLTEAGTQILGSATSNIPQIVFDGSLLGVNGGAGLIIDNTTDVVIKDIAVVNFQGNTQLTGIGIHITGASATGNQIVSCYIGVNPQTKLAAPNQRAGVQIDGNAYANRIGSANLPNVISGNGSNGSAGNGVLLLNSTKNAIQGNFIGVVPVSYTHLDVYKRQEKISLLRVGIVVLRSINLVIMPPRVSTPSELSLIHICAWKKFASVLMPLLIQYLYKSLV